MVAYRLVQVGGVSFHSIFRRACLEQSAKSRKIHLRFNDPVELEAGMLTTDDASAGTTVEQCSGALATLIGKGVLVLNAGNYLSLMRKEGPLIEVL